MEPIGVGRVDLTQYHDCSVSDSGYYSFEETQLGDNGNTGCGIEGLGRNCGPKSDTGGYPYRHLEYETVYIREGAQQLEQQADLRIRTPEMNVEKLMEQQMSLMREVMQMLNAQIVHLRNQMNTGNRLDVKPEKFAGTSSFHSFIAKFENCCEINGWDEREKLLMLKNSLTGNAVSILWEFGSEKQQSYSELVERLKVRYGFEGQSESFRRKLRARRQHHGETLCSLEQEIRKLISLAYPGETSNIIELIARDAFIEALSDRDLALQILAKEPKTLEMAYQVAIRLKSCQDLIYSAKRHESLTSESDEKICRVEKEAGDREQKQTSDQRKEMVQAIQDVTERVSQFGADLEKLKCLSTCTINTSRPYKKTVRCFHCNKEGHMRFQCPDKDDISEPRRGYKSSLFRNSKNISKTRTVKIPPRSEVSVALEEFLDEFETLFGGEDKEEHEVEAMPGKVTAHQVSDPSTPGLTHDESILGGEARAPCNFVLRSPHDSDTGFSDRYRTLHDSSTVHNETTQTSNHTNNTFNDESPKGSPKRLSKLKESVCSSFSRRKKSDQKAWRVQTSIPRPCVYCRMVLGSRALMRRHIQEEHQDILLMKKRTRQDPGTNSSADEFEPDVRPPESAKPTRGEVRFAEH